jgi:hypothetical protein
MYQQEPNEFEAEQTPPPEPKPKPSMVPSWVMLGFIVGALFVWALPKRESASASAPPEAPSLVVQATSRLTTIEAVFAEWGQYAVWHQDRTEIALWNSEIQAYSDCYEVLRNDGAFFFRSIPRLTHPLLTHGLQANLENCPIQFTETTAQRTTWLGEKNQETWRSISTAARENMGVASPAPTPPPPALRP